MAQTGYTPISLYYTTTASAVPTAGNLVNGELAININTADGKLFYKDSAGVVQALATKGTAVIGGANSQVQYNSGGALAGSANFTFDGTVVQSGGYRVVPPSGTSATATFYAGTSTSNVSFLQIGSESTYTYASSRKDGSGTYLPYQIFTSDSPRITVDASGYVGIGTTSPSSFGRFAVYNASGDTSDLAVFQRASTGTFRIRVPSAATAVIGTPFNDNLGFETNAITRMTIDTNGNIGVNATPSAWAGYTAIQLPNGASVTGNTGTNSMILASNLFSSNSGSSWTYTTSTGGILQVLEAGSAYYYTAPSGTAGTTASISKIVTVNPYGIGLGAGTPSSGLGITFPATQSGSSGANTLDDYEEGTFTPVFTGTSSNPTATYNNQYGQYTKIGNLVYITLRLGSASISGGGGNLGIGGLPFGANDGAAYPAVSVGYKNGWNTNGPDYGRVVGTNIEIYKSNNTGETNITTANLANGVDIIMTATYTAS